MAFIANVSNPNVNLDQYNQDMTTYAGGMKDLGQTGQMFNAAAQGTGPNAGMMQAQQGAQQQADFARANAASAGGLAHGNAMKMALGQATGASQGANMLGQQLQASQQMQGAAQQMQLQLAQRAAQLQAQGMSAEQAYQQSMLELQTYGLQTNIQGQNQKAGMDVLKTGASAVAGLAGLFA